MWKLTYACFSKKIKRKAQRYQKYFPPFSWTVSCIIPQFVITWTKELNTDAVELHMWYVTRHYGHQLFVSFAHCVLDHLLFFSFGRAKPFLFPLRGSYPTNWPITKRACTVAVELGIAPHQLHAFFCCFAVVFYLNFLLYCDLWYPAVFSLPFAKPSTLHSFYPTIQTHCNDHFVCCPIIFSFCWVAQVTWLSTFQ